MPSVNCVQYFRQTCRPLCNTCIVHLITLLNTLMLRYHYALLNAKCHKVTLTMKLLVIGIA